MASDTRPTLALSWAENVHLADRQPFRELIIGNAGDGPARDLSVAVEHQGSGHWETWDQLEGGGEVRTAIPLSSYMRLACGFFDSLWVSDGDLVTPQVTITWKQGQSDEPMAVRLLAPLTPDPIPDDVPGADQVMWQPPAMFVPGRS